MLFCYHCGSCCWCVCECVCVCIWGGREESFKIVYLPHFFCLLTSSALVLKTVAERVKLSALKCLLHYRWSRLCSQVFPLTLSYSEILCVINIVGVQNTTLIKWHLSGFVGFSLPHYIKIPPLLFEQTAEVYFCLFFIMQIIYELCLHE